MTLPLIVAGVFLAAIPSCSERESDTVSARNKTSGPPATSAIAAPDDGPRARTDHGVDPANLTEKKGNMNTEKATFAAGCFWGVEATFRQIEGVVSTVVGYTGGHSEDPIYRDVCSDRTGHAEAVCVEFDPSRVSYEELLDVFWNSHDPTALNRQGLDVGSQYRSAVFYHSPAQQAAARASKERLEQSGRFNEPIVTQIGPAAEFYKAEEYHQQYLAKHGRTSCASTVRD